MDVPLPPAGGVGVDGRAPEVVGVARRSPPASTCDRRDRLLRLVLGADDEDRVGGVVVDDRGVAEDLREPRRRRSTAFSVSSRRLPAALKIRLTWTPECARTLRVTGLPT